MQPISFFKLVTDDEHASQVNGVDVTKVSHQEAVLALLDPSYQVVLTVRHDPLPVGWQVGHTTAAPSRDL